MRYPSSSEETHEPKRISPERGAKTLMDSDSTSPKEPGSADPTSKHKLTIPVQNKPPDHRKQLDPVWKPGSNNLNLRTLPSNRPNPPQDPAIQRRDGLSSGSNNRSDSIESTSSAPFKPHTGGDIRWDAINAVNARESPLGLSHFRLLKRLGYGDIGSVYLVELRGTSAHFAMKVMDKVSLASRNKLLRAQTEREILGLLDHPFLPTLYSHFETDKFYCLVIEFCSGGNLHSLRQKQPNKHFTEEAARFVTFFYSLKCNTFSFGIMCQRNELNQKIKLMVETPEYLIYFITPRPSHESPLSWNSGWRTSLLIHRDDYST